MRISTETLQAMIAVMEAMDAVQPEGWENITMDAGSTENPLSLQFNLKDVLYDLRDERVGEE